MCMLACMHVCDIYIKVNKTLLGAKLYDSMVGSYENSLAGRVLANNKASNILEPTKTISIYLTYSIHNHIHV